MKKLAQVLTGAVLAFMVFFLLALQSAQLRVSVIEYEAVPARSDPALTEQLIETARTHDMLGDLYRRPLREGLDSYQLIKIRLRARNLGLFPAEWAKLWLTPDALDIALFAAGEQDIPGMGRTRDIVATLLCEAEAPDNRRAMQLTYYVLGHKFEIGV